MDAFDAFLPSGFSRRWLVVAAAALLVCGWLIGSAAARVLLAWIGYRPRESAHSPASSEAVPPLPGLGPLARAVVAAVGQGATRGARVAARVREVPEYADLPSVAVYPVLKRLVSERVIWSWVVVKGDALPGDSGAVYYSVTVPPPAAFLQAQESDLPIQGGELDDAPLTPRTCPVQRP